jgi:hypothetical protein
MNFFLRNHKFKYRRKKEENKNVNGRLSNLVLIVTLKLNYLLLQYLIEKCGEN